MAMKDMALTKAEAKAQELGCCAPGEGGDLPRYPYGLELRLDDESLAKLGMQTPAVGQELVLSAKVTVTGFSFDQRQGREDHQCLELQITAMDLMAPLTSADDRTAKAASKLYPDKQ